jgi:hypothetical protein
MAMRECECASNAVAPSGRHQAERLWEMTHGYDCVELYEARIVRLTDEQAESLRERGAVLMPFGDMPTG